MTASRPLIASERVNYYKTTMQPLLGDGNERLKRHWKYLKEVCPDYFIQGLRAGTFLLMGTAGGASGGGLLAGQITRIVSTPSESGDYDNRLIYLGVAVGTVVGVYIGFQLYLDDTEKCRYFQEWHEKNKEDLINFSMFLQYTHDSFLKGCVCQLSQNILVGPCRTPTGYLVEYQMITQIARDAQGKITCPFTREAFFDTEIRKDYERALVINKRALQLMQEDVNEVHKNPDLLKLLTNQMNFIKESVNECYENCLLDIEKRRMLKLITFADSQNERNSFVEHFGEVPDHHLDWALDWKGILDGRWKKRYPDDRFY